MPGPGDIAPTEIVVLERPAADGPYGAKGPGEMCANPQIPAIANAVFDAVGVRIDTMPITPERILRALKATARAPARTSPMMPDTGTASALRPRRRRWPRGLAATRYLADDGLATAIFLAIRLGKPLLLEGAPGVGKTEAAKAHRRDARRASWSGCNATRASMPRTRSTNGTISASFSPSARPASARSTSTTTVS